MTRPYVPQPVLDAAHARSAARAARDWATADRLRDEIEAAGWRVVDAGTDFSLEPAHPPDVEVAGRVRYGRSAAVPSRLGEVSTGLATVIVPAGDDVEALDRAISALRATVPAGVDIVVVADDATAAMDALLERLEPGVEVVRTSVRLGAGAALNIGLRRATGTIVVLVDPSVEVLGDVVSPLVAALDDPAVVVAGAFGFRTADLRTFVAAPAGEPAASVGGDLMAFRRADAATLGPVDEGFVVARHLDTWWSLVLRDSGTEPTASGVRSVRVVPDLPFRQHPRPAGTSAVTDGDAGRAAKRNFYRLANRFRDRADLLEGPGD